MVNLSFVRGIVFFKQKTAYEVRISDRSSDVCSSDLTADVGQSLSADAAFRVTGVYEDSGSYRDGVTVRREGINPTLLFTAGDATRIRAEKRRVGKAGVSTVRSRWSPYH